MERKRVPTWGFFIGSAGFLTAAIVRVLRGGELDGTFLVLAIIFAILGINVARGNRRDGSQPPAA